MLNGVISENEKLSRLRDARKFKNYVIGEIDFYIQYFDSYLFILLAKWRKEIGGKEDDVSRRMNFGNLQTDEFKNLLATVVELLKKYRIKFVRDYNVFEHQIRVKGEIKETSNEALLRLAIWSSVFTNDEYAKLSPFGPAMIYIGELMNHHPIGILDALEQILWIEDEIHKKSNAESQGDVPANGVIADESNRMENIKKNLWKVDLLRAQLLLLSANQRFYSFMTDDLDINLESAKILIANWYNCLKKREEISIQLERMDIDAYTDGQISNANYRLLGKKNEIDKKIDKILKSVSSLLSYKLWGKLKSLNPEEMADKKLKNLAERAIAKSRDKFYEYFLLERDGIFNVLDIHFKSDADSIFYKGFSLYKNIIEFLEKDDFRKNEKIREGKHVNVYVEQLENIVGETFTILRDRFKEVWSELFSATYLYEEAVHPPLVQLIKGNSSAWSSRDEVPGIIVINEKKAKSEDQFTRLEAYGAVTHELGHILDSSFRDSCLTEHFIKTIESSKHLKFRYIWMSWVSEIFADGVGAALFGFKSVAGLQMAIKDSMSLDFTMSRDDHFDPAEYDYILKPYEPHPTPFLRLKFAYIMGEKLSDESPGEDYFLKLALYLEWKIWQKMPSEKTITQETYDKLMAKYKKEIEDNQFGDIKAYAMALLKSKILFSIVDYNTISISSLDSKKLPLDDRIETDLSELVSGDFKINKGFEEEYLTGEDYRIYDQVENKEYNPDDIIKEFEVIYKILFEEPHPCLNNRTLRNLCDHIRKDKGVFHELTTSFADNLGFVKQPEDQVANA